MPARHWLAGRTKRRDVRAAAGSGLRVGLLSRQADHDIDGLTASGGVMGDSAAPAVQPDQAIEQGQAAAGLVFGGGLLPDRPPVRGVVVDLHPQVTAGQRHADVDHPVTVTDGVGGQFADDELGEVGVLGKAPSRQCLTGLLASAPDLGRLAAQPTAHEMHGRVSNHLLTVPP
jgi:hypothetical protein